MEYSSVYRGWALPLCSLFFLCALYWNGHGGDLGYWTSWMQQMAQGYRHAQANYPPLLLHWFWLLAKIFDFAGFEYPPVSTVQLKFFVLLPVLATQLWLCHRVERSLYERNVQPLKSPVFWAVVASPALLLDGPVWGQVDLLPFLPMWLKLRCRWMVWAVSLQITRIGRKRGSGRRRPGAESCPANRRPHIGPRRNLRWKYWPDQCNNVA